VLTTLAPACATQEASSENREITRKNRSLLIGRWYGDEHLRSGTHQRWLVTREADGTFEVEFDVTLSNGRREHGFESGTWGIRHPIYFTTTRESGPSRSDMATLDPTDPRLYDAYEIVELDDEVFTYVSFASGNQFSVRRVDDDFSLGSGEIRCAEPLPSFKLDQPALNEAQQDALCACLWSGLDEKLKGVARLIAEDRRSEVPDDEYAEFFGEWFIFVLPQCIAEAVLPEEPVDE
jgi:hypothetical protein